MGVENNNHCNHIAREAALAHFSLMFGYKIFSLYYPLFLAAAGLSLTQIGKVYFWIYFPMALAAPLAGFLSRVIHPAIMAAAACSGYAAYALGMAFWGGAAMAYLWQIVLGISAAFFFTASRALLIADSDGDVEHDFSWFYNASFWSAALAPAAGAIIVWRFGFEAAFMTSAAICVWAALVSAGMITNSWHMKHGHLTWGHFKNGWEKAFKLAFPRSAAGYIALSFIVLLAANALHPFFVLFLRDDIGLSQAQVLHFTAIMAAAFSILYFFVLRRRQNGHPEAGILRGAQVAGASTIIFAVFLPVLSYVGAFFLELARSVGGFFANTGRSALLAKELKSRPAEGAALDTIFAPLGIAISAMLGGYIIEYLNYQWLLLITGAMMLAAYFIVSIAKNGEMR